MSMAASERSALMMPTRVIAVEPLTIDAAGHLIQIECDESVDAAGRRALTSAFSHLISGGEPHQRILASMSFDSEIPEAGGFARGISAVQLVRSVADAVDGLVMAAQVPDTTAGRADELPAVVGLRASAVSTDEGAVVLLGGPSRQVALQALSESAALIGSDTVLIDRRDRSVTGIPGVVNMGGASVETARWVAPGQAGLRTQHEPEQLRAVVFLEHAVNETSSWHPVSTPEAIAMAAAAVPSLSAVKRPLVALDGIFQMAPGAVVVRYRKPEDIAELIAEVLAHPVERTWAQAANTRAVESARTPAIGDVRRAAMIDVITDGQYMAFCTTQYAISAVGGTAPMMWDLADDWIGIDELTSRLVDAMGEPEGDAREIVGASVEALVGLGVLVRV
ncbi:hypothetical protein ACFWHT_03315 [Microbacterium sp. NPDC058342]|uniref:hypothetical protein n=1 Tax=Microbacterium sp. NPDC058342 TaxID=3346454 RepID=UPI00365E4E1D